MTLSAAGRSWSNCEFQSISRVYGGDREGTKGVVATRTYTYIVVTLVVVMSVTCEVEMFVAIVVTKVLVCVVEIMLDSSLSLLSVLVSRRWGSRQTNLLELLRYPTEVEDADEDSAVDDTGTLMFGPWLVLPM